MTPDHKHNSLLTQDYNFKFVLILLLINLTLPGCSQKTPEPVATEAPVTTPDTAQNEIKQKYQLAIEAMRFSEYSRAEGIFREIIREQPDYSGPYANLALIHFKQGEHEKSLTLVNKAIDLNNQQSQAFHLRAQLQLKSGKINEARDDYLTALEINPDYLNAHYNLALLYDIYLQELALAIKHYEAYQALLDKPDTANRDWINHLKNTLENG